MTFELCNCENQLLGDIADKSQGRRSVAMTYALALKSSEQIDWRKVNQAILGRWSFSGLNWIKEQAVSGKCFAKH